MYTDYSSECLLCSSHTGPPSTRNVFSVRQSAAAAVSFSAWARCSLVLKEHVVIFLLISARRSAVFFVPIPGLPAQAANLVAVGVLLLVLLNQPVLDGGGRLAGVGALLALDLDGHVLVLLQRGGEIGLLGGLGRLGLVEGQDLALGVVGLECWCLVGLEFFQVEFLDEVGCESAAVSVSMRLRMISKAA